MASPVSCRGVQPRAWQTSASRSKVHSQVGLPQVRGLWCSRSFKGSLKRSSRKGRAEWGREDFSSRQAIPSRWKALMALRTVPVEQPRLRAICAGRRPAELASRIWQRRTVKASLERSPAWACCRSVGVRCRTKRGGRMYHYSGLTCFRQDLL